MISFYLKISSVNDFLQTYTVGAVIMFFLNLKFIVTVLRHGIKNERLRLLMWFGVIAIAQDIISMYNILLAKKHGDYEDKKLENRISIILFILFEFGVVMRFYFSYFRSLRTRMILKFLTGIYALFSTGILLVLMNTEKVNCPQTSISWLSTLSSIILLIPVAVYYFEILTKAPNVDILRDYNFWLFVGFTFLFSLIFPLFLIDHYLETLFGRGDHGLYVINFFAYSIAFVCLIRAVKVYKRHARIQGSIETQD